jgi:hypothetical protein
MHQQLWGYKVEEKLYAGVREQKRLNATAVDCFSAALATYHLLARTSVAEYDVYG